MTTSTTTPTRPLSRDEIATAVASTPRSRKGHRSTKLEESLVWHSLTDEACWPWAGPITSHGYGLAAIPGGGGRVTTAHRVIWTIMHGPVDRQTQIDHACHDADECGRVDRDCPHRACVNPNHLQALSARDNTLRSNGPSAINARRTHCKNGHEFTAENTYLHVRGRACRICRRAADRRSYRKETEA